MKSVRENSKATPKKVSTKPALSKRRSAVAAVTSSADEPWKYAETGSHEDLTGVVGSNLRRLRSQRHLSLEKLAAQSGVSRAMLGQIELGQSAPTINVLWKVARSLGVPFSALTTEPLARTAAVLHAAGAKILTSQDGAFTSRALFPFDRSRSVEFYELRLRAHASEHAEAHAPGTVENLVVTAGALEITVAASTHALREGDAILFEADTPHTYRNTGAVDTVMYLVMTYAEKLA